MRQQQAPFVNRRVDFTTPGWVPPAPVRRIVWVHNWDDEPCDDPGDAVCNGDLCRHGARIREVWAL